jgi:hypothetical protein
MVDLRVWKEKTQVGCYIVRPAKRELVVVGGCQRFDSEEVEDTVGGRGELIEA